MPFIRNIIQVVYSQYYHRVYVILQDCTQTDIDNIRREILTMKQNISTIQPYIDITFKGIPERELTSPCSMHIYDACAKNLNDVSVPDTLSVIPSAGCVWIIAYNSPAQSRFICIGSQSEKMGVDISGYDNYFIAVFDDDAVYFNKGAADTLTPAAIADRIIDFKPDETCPEYDFLTRIADINNFDDKCKAFKEYLSSSKRRYVFSKDMSDMRSIILKADGDCTVNTLSEITGYSCRHINRLFNASYGFGPKDLCKRLRFQHALKEIFTDCNRQNSEFIQNIDYSDQAHFQREFKSFMGETPKQFIRKIQSSASKS